MKNQQSCGSCYSFSAMSGVEGLYWNVNKKIVTFSEQQIVDCSRSYGNNGCYGGEMVGVIYRLGPTITWQPMESPLTQTTPMLLLNRLANSPKQCRNSRFPDSKTWPKTANRQWKLPSTSKSLQLESMSTQLSRTMTVESSTMAQATQPTTTTESVLLVTAKVLWIVDHFVLRNQWGTGWGTNGYMLITNKYET